MHSEKETESPMTKRLRRVTSDSGQLSQITLHRAKSRRKRLRIVRQLKYTCQGKTLKSTDGAVSETTLESGNGVVADGEDVTRSVARGSHGCVSVIGRRREMEDAVMVGLKFAVKGTESYDFYGVYDGHGGAVVADACREKLHSIVAAEMAAEEAEGGGSEFWERIMTVGFSKMDDEVAEIGGSTEANTVGSTAVVAVVGSTVVAVANCGDSRAVLSKNGVAVPLSIDHKPDRKDELERIEGAGGKVINWNGHRVLGVLATSRSIGDHYLKPYVISKPDVKTIDRTESDEFLILASDGLWDVVSNDTACQFVRKCLNGLRVRDGPADRTVSETRTAKAAALLTELAISKGSSDNISVIVINLKK